MLYGQVVFGTCTVRVCVLTHVIIGQVELIVK